MEIGRIRLILVVMALVICSGLSWGATVKVVPSVPKALAGQDFYIDIVAEDIPSGLGSVQFRLNATAVDGKVVGVTTLNETGASEIGIAAPLLASQSTSVRSGMGDFFWSGVGPNGILVLENNPFTNGSALFAFGHTDGSVPPSGSGSVARFRVRIGSLVDAKQVTFSLSDVVLLNGENRYEITSVTSATVASGCFTTMPNLIGTTLPDALALLAQAQLIKGTVYELDNSSGSYELNRVLEQSLAANSEARCGTTVNFAINIPPVVTIDAGPSLTNTSAISLTGTREEGAIISVSANTSAVIGAVSYLTSTTWSCPVTALQEGANSIMVTASDQAGNKQTATRVVVNDTTPPVVTIITPVLNTNQRQPVLTYTVSDGSVVVKLDGTVISKVSGATFDPLVDGPYTVRVEATDAAGNTGFAEKTFTVDTVPPVVSIASPVNGSISNDTTPLLSYTATEGTVQVKLDNVVIAKASGDSLDPVTENQHVIRVEATDQAGNIGFAEAQFTTDITPPTVTITAPAAEYIKTPTPQLMYAISDGVAVVKVDGNVVAKASGDHLDAMTDGLHTVVVEATDTATNVGTATKSFTVDTVPPVLTVNEVLSPAVTTSQLISGKIEEHGVVTVVSGTSAKVEPVIYPTAITWQCTVTDLVEGANVFTIAAKDRAGNETTVETTVNYIRGIWGELSPSTISSTYQGIVRLTLRNLISAGSDVLVEQLVDVNRNGVPDAGDYVIRNFTVTDEIPPLWWNPNVPADSDGAVDAAIQTYFSYFLITDMFHAPGAYLFRFTNGSNTSWVPFVVTSAGMPQAISGTITDGVNPFPGALVRLFDKWRRPITFAIADAEGNYSFDVRDPGEYYVVPLVYGNISEFGKLVTVAVNQSVVGEIRSFKRGTFTLSGRVVDDVTGSGISGISVLVEGPDIKAVALTDSAGAYELTVPAGVYTVSALDIAMSNLSLKGYVATIGEISISSDITYNISASFAEYIIAGSITTINDDPVVGIPVLVDNGGVASGVSDSSGLYIIPAKSDWYGSYAVLADDYCQYLGFVSVYPNIGMDFTDFYVEPINAWVKGVVEDTLGRPVAGVDINVFESHLYTPVLQTSTAVDGSYRVGLSARGWAIEYNTNTSVNPFIVRLTAQQTLQNDIIAHILAPLLTIDPVSATTQRDITITGTKEDVVDRITVVTSTSAKATVTFTSSTTWSCSVTGLPVGDTTLTFTAKDYWGQETTKSVFVTRTR